MCSRLFIRNQREKVTREIKIGLFLLLIGAIQENPIEVLGFYSVLFSDKVF